MREEFFIERQGKRFVLFAGLLDEAHQERHDLFSIDTLLVQAPNEKNGNVAIVFAKVTLDANEPPGERRYFTGLGDASPENVGRNIAPHLIRMAETRAKARALRDAVNVGVTAFEEIDSGAEDASESPKQATPPPALKSVPAPSEEPMQATRAQREMLRVLLEEWNEKGVMLFEQRNGPIDALNAAQANEHIERLSEVVGSPE